MSDPAPSSSRPGRRAGERGRRAEEPGAPRRASLDGASPLVADQPTVISNRPGPPSGSGDPRRAPPEPEAEVQASDLLPGTRLAHFELLEYIGGGGMGRVFRALDTRLDRPVALKILSREQACDTETFMRFRNEAQLAARLNHQGIAQVYYLGEEGGLAFIAFEFIEGTNVRDLVAQDGPLPLAKAVSYTLQVAEALAHAAASGVVHRDIKPSNVLITPEGRVKLIDLGLARIEQGGARLADELTASGVTLGTFDYISPEQARDPRNADLRSDVYSLGCTLFYMLTGRPPFPEGTVLQKLLQHQGIEPPDVRQFRPDLPEEVSRILRKMTAKEPRRRYQEASELIDALLLLAQRVGLRRAGPRHARWTVLEEPKVSFFRRHVPWLVPVAALVVVVALLQIFWTSSGPEGAQPSRARLSGPDEPEQEPPPVEGSPESKAPLVEAEAATGGSPGPAAAENKIAPSGAAETPDDGQPSADLSDTRSAKSEKGAMAGLPGLAGPNTRAGKLPMPPIATPSEKSPPKPAGTPETPRADRAGTPEAAAEAGAAQPGQSSTGVSAPSEAATEQERPGEAALRPGAPEAATVPPDPGLNGTGAWIVDPNGEPRSSFATLGDACGAAGYGDVIELRYDGRLEAAPVTLAHRDLVIRAAEGFHPVLGFRPSEVDPPASPRSMFTLVGSLLTLSGVTIELDIPRGVPSQSWSLFAIGDGKGARLDRCWLTIRNASDGRTAYHQQVACFRLGAAGTDALVREERADVPPPVVIELDDCVVRGEAVFLRTAAPQPVDLIWKRGSLLTTEQLLAADGMETSPQPNEVIRVWLEQVTAVVDGGLCRLSASQLEPHLPAVEVECVRSVVMGTPKASLIDQVGVTDGQQALSAIQWRGDRNTYEGFHDYWTIRYLSPEVPAEVKSFDEWKSWWGEENEKQPASGLIDPSRLPSAKRPVNSLTPEDYGWTAPGAGRAAVTEQRPEAYRVTP